jgi:adenosylcobyric acid synthase
MKIFDDKNQTLMIQGTTSDAGKTVLVAGLCRVLARHNASVAPLKPQNMALNSMVTIDGGEIGRAQALHAEACYLPAHTDMNPVLLKPSTDTGAQVIIHGKAISAMEAAQFHDYKKVAMGAVLKSHQRLTARYQKIIVEGAGSPAEINLREGDIANMGFAEAVNCPVILIADIDRGGVFAHLVGTLELLAASEQARVIGFVINRFRGDIALLKPGLDWLEQKTGKPVLGVLPYLQDFYLDAEDAISTLQITGSGKKLKVVVPVLSRISNHTDFDPLRLHPNVDLTFVSVNDDNIEADLIILPGSKNVRADLALLLAAGWREKLQRHLRYGGKLLGICGGYQMLGEIVSDPEGIEGLAGETNGFGFLPLRTTLEAHKQLRQVQAQLAMDIVPRNDDVLITGYEIHCGTTEVVDGHSLLTEVKHLLLPALPDAVQTHYESINDMGWQSEDGQILGCYIHGLFDTPAACQAFLTWAGLTEQEQVVVDIAAKRDTQLNRLADCLEEHLSDDFMQALLV